MINKVDLLSSPQILNGNNKLQTNNNEKTNFSAVLKQALNNVSKAEHEADFKRDMLALNQIDDLHDVMITAQKASITIETTVQIQQKVIDTYNEIMRMQI